jgi:DNA-binding transcriptional ArsR family regulator
MRNAAHGTPRDGSWTIATFRALADPIRYRILGHLMAVGPQTASQCAAVVGPAPANCSYHLRDLARYGLGRARRGGRRRRARTSLSSRSSGSARAANSPRDLQELKRTGGDVGLIRGVQVIGGMLGG